MNLTEVLSHYRYLLANQGREAADQWLYSHHEPSAALRDYSPLDLIVVSFNDEGKFVNQKGECFDPYGNYDVSVVW